MEIQEVSEPIIVIPGSSRKLESEIEAGRDEALHFKAPIAESKLALYGPYAFLPRGRYRLELLFFIRKRGSGVMSIELCHRMTTIVLYTRMIRASEVKRGLIRISFPVKYEVQDLEIRLRVPPGCEGSIKQLSIDLQSHHPEPSPNQIAQRFLRKIFRS